MTLSVPETQQVKTPMFCSATSGIAADIIAGTKKCSRPLLLALLVLNLFCLDDLAVAQEAEDQSATEAVSADSSNEELLLFWEEKELFVETATRTAKPISQVAENMAVVTAKDIEDMNAHTVAEVLNRVPGLYVDFQGTDFGSPSLVHIQGSSFGEDRHVTVLLDGVPRNFLGGGGAETISIPVQIIDRIEIIKGPASSAWGSSLGGVINIITKSTGDNKVPSGTVSLSHGQANSLDYNAQLLGKGGAAGYYLFAGRQESDGLRDNRFYHRNSIYGKLSVAPRNDFDFVVSAGYSNPFLNGGDNPLRQANTNSKTSTFFITGLFDYRLATDLSLKGSAFTSRQKLDYPVRDRMTNQTLAETLFDEQAVGGNLKLVYNGVIQTAVMGIDISHGTMDQTVDIGGPPRTTITPSINKMAFFANDTIAVNKFAITPGMRVDHNNVSGTFVSPSLGATYEFSEHAIARASVARGFTTPPLAFSAGGGFSINPNPKLKYESVMSYLVGLESAFMDYLNLKGTLFRHNAKDEIVFQPPSRMFINSGSVIRQGYEVEAETVPVYNTSIKAAHSFVHIDADSQPEGKVNYSYQVGIKYDDRKSVIAQLFGNYVWWDQDPANGAQHNTFIWDAHLNKKFHLTDKATIDAFISVHNIFNGAYYTIAATPNPGRWVEGGLRLKY